MRYFSTFGNVPNFRATFNVTFGTHSFDVMRSITGWVTHTFLCCWVSIWSFFRTWFKTTFVIDCIVFLALFATKAFSLVLMHVFRSFVRAFALVGVVRVWKLFSCNVQDRRYKERAKKQANKQTTTKNRKKESTHLLVRRI
jgi:hypothetical protein